MLVKIFSGAVSGIEATTITIEVNILWGAKFIIVGLPDCLLYTSPSPRD